MKIRVYLATTEGPIQIERITRERIENSLICVKRTNRVLSISPSYDAFVKPGSGVIEREFGPFEQGAFRLDVSGEIVDGDSWQLAVFVAHALDAKGKLAAPDEDASTAVLLTGRVDYDLNILPVEFVSKKLVAARDEFTELLSLGFAVSVFVPTVNLGDIDAPNLLDGVKLVGADAAGKVLDKLGVTQQKSVSKDTAAPARNLSPPSQQQNVGSTGTHAMHRRNPLRAMVAMLVLLLAAAAVVNWYPRIVPYFTAFEKESASVEDAKPLQTDEIGAAASVETVVAPEAEADTPLIEEKPNEPQVAIRLEDAPDSEMTQSEEQAVPASRIEITLFGRHAPDGRSCPAVHFGSATAELVPIPRQDQNEFATSRHAGLCGLEFAVESFGEPRYVSVVFDIRSGRFLETPPLPVGLNGNVLLQGRESWSIDIPYRMKHELEYRFAVIASGDPSANDAAWLSAQPDWESALSELTSRGIEIVLTAHRVIP